MNSDRQRRIAVRISQMPRSYRAVYEKAVRGRSLRASINSFCLECICFQVEEIRNCSDKACPLWAVRPYQSVVQDACEGRSTRTRGTMSSTPRLW